MSDRTEELSEVVQDRMLVKKNVVGVAGGEDKVLVFVERKEPLSALHTNDVVDRDIEGVRTDVIEVGKLKAMLAPGASIGLPNGGTGTLGGLVEDEMGNLYALTNNHVAAASNLARVLTPIHSPGPADGLGAQIGELDRFQPIYFDRVNLIDAALVRLREPVEPFAEPETITGRVGWWVQKTGRTSGHTWGTVLARNATVDIDFGSQGVARFSGQIITEPMLEPGDSGSVILSRSGYPIALGFAGSSAVSIHNPINLVLRTLGVRFAHPYSTGEEAVLIQQ